MTNEEARDQIVIFMCDEQKVINDRDKQALDMAIKALETIPKYKDAYGKGWDDGAKATYEHLKMCEEEQDNPNQHNSNALNALEGDAISRQWLMECINEGWIKFDTEKDTNRFIHLIRDMAPPVTPQPKTDVLDKIRDEIDAHREKLKTMADDDWYAGKIRGYDCAIEIIDKYRESEVKE